MVNGIRTSDPGELNEGRGLKFRVGTKVQQTPEEGHSVISSSTAS